MTKLKSHSALVLAAVLLLVLTLAPVLAQEVTPLPPVELGVVDGLPQQITDQGYPQIGWPDAPVQVVEFCSFDVLACGAYDRDVFPALLDGITGGHILYTVMPLAGLGDIPNGRIAARAALCAGEQGAFWGYREMLYQGQAEYGDEAFESGRLLDLLDRLDLDRDLWQECMLSDRSDLVLGAASAALDLQPDFADSLPFVLVNGVPVLPDLESVTAAVDLELATATVPSAEATAEGTETPLVVTVEPLLGEAIEPPLDLNLPPGWRYGYDTLILTDVDGAIRSIPLAVYTGPVSGGEGTIVLLWGFPNLMAGNPFQADSMSADLWSDGLRLLRLAVIEEGCNIGTDLRREYTIGGMPAAGTQFSAVDCPELPDTRGWFAGLQREGINFVFYAFTDPIDAMSSAQSELQSLLDSVVFDIPTPEATPTAQP